VIDRNFVLDYALNGNISQLKHGHVSVSLARPRG